MKTLSRFISVSLFFMFFIHNSYSQGSGVGSPAMILAHIADNQTQNAIPENNGNLHAILDNYEVQIYEDAFPGAHSSYLQQSKLIIPIDTNDLDNLKLALEQSLIFDLVEIEHSFIVLNPPSPSEVIYSPIQIETPINECSNPVQLNDPFSSNAPYYLELMELPCAWTITEGDPNISVGIVDVFFDYHHDELDGKLIDIGLNCDPNLSNCDHGFGSAGSIAAIHNATCVAGAGK